MSLISKWKIKWISTKNKNQWHYITTCHNNQVKKKKKRKKKPRRETIASDDDIIRICTIAGGRLWCDLLFKNYNCTLPRRNSGRYPLHDLPKLTPPQGNDVVNGGMGKTNAYITWPMKLHAIHKHNSFPDLDLGNYSGSPSNKNFPPLFLLSPCPRLNYLFIKTMLISDQRIQTRLYWLIKFNR